MYSDRRGNRQNHPGQKPLRTIEREFVQGAFVRVFCTRPTKNRGGPRCVTYFQGGSRDVWQSVTGGGGKIGQKLHDVRYGRPQITSAAEFSAAMFYPIWKLLRMGNIVQGLVEACLQIAYVNLGVSGFSNYLQASSNSFMCISSLWHGGLWNFILMPLDLLWTLLWLRSIIHTFVCSQIDLLFSRHWLISLVYFLYLIPLIAHLLCFSHISACMAEQLHFIGAKPDAPSGFAPIKV